MLDNLDEITSRYATIDENRLLVGGQCTSNRDHSPFRKVRHSVKLKTFKDLEKVFEDSLNERQQREDRKAKNKNREPLNVRERNWTHSIQDEPSDEMENGFSDFCEKSPQKQGDITMVYDERRIYHIHSEGGRMIKVGFTIDATD